MKIVDSFMFFDENMMLDLRLNILNKYVSKFIICEATYNHKGEEKKLNFDIKNFKKFKSKIEYVILEKKPHNLKRLIPGETEDKKKSKILDNALIRENYQRNYINNLLMNCEENDLILINDLDEIPNLKKLKYKKKITVFQQMMLYFKFDLMYPNILWTGSKICKKKHFKNPQWLRNIKTRKYPLWRLDLLFSQKKYNNIQIIKNGGWHFTNIKTAESIHHKMKNFLHHYEYEQSGLGITDIKNLINKKKALYNYGVDQRKEKWSSNIDLVKVNLDLLPKYIIDNKKKFEDWLSN